MDSIITVKTAQRAAQAARAAAKAAVVTVKAIAKATALAIKAIIAGTKALIAAIAAGGWVAVLVIIVICLIGMILGSVFGIFFSDEDSGTGMSMQTVVQEINTEYDTKLQEEKNSVSYDVLEMSGSRAVWKEVLAVYSVKTNTDQDNPQEVATMDDGKKQLLKDIFWEMNQISSRTESKTETVITETDDGHGNIVETESTVTQTYLYITVSHKTAEEMAAQYGFNEEQKGYLAELLADENNYLWSQVLYGITGGDGQIVTVALSLVGNVGGQPYWSWYGIDMEAEGQYSKLIDEIPVPDIAISMGCNVGCPFIERPFDDNWGLEDPTGKSDEEFKKVIDEIRMQIFILKQRLDEFEEN